MVSQNNAGADCFVLLFLVKLSVYFCPLFLVFEAAEEINLIHVVSSITHT